MPSSFKELRVWQEAMKFVVTVYRTTNNFRNMSYTDSATNYDAQPCPYQATSRKEKDTDRIENSGIFSCTQEDRCWKCRHN